MAISPRKLLNRTWLRIASSLYRVVNKYYWLPGDVGSSSMMSAMSSETNQLEVLFETVIVCRFLDLVALPFSLNEATIVNSGQIF
jgi:hypothetical protein